MNKFELVEGKLFEADFFLDKLKACSGLQIQDAKFYLSAFISAGRTITFALQKSLRHQDGFDEWYEKHQNNLKENQLAKFYYDARNEGQHEGYYHINMGRYFNEKTEFLFHSIDNKNVLEEDMVTASHKYLVILLEIVFDCFNVFGYIVNPDIFYSIDEIKKRGQTVKDIEMEIWGYPKWTSIGMSENDSLKYIINNMVPTPIDKLFIKYLGKTKDGIPAENASR